MDKYKTGKKYKFTKGIYKNDIVIPINFPHNPWEHGITGFKDAETKKYIGWCGIQFFEENTDESL